PLAEVRSRQAADEAGIPRCDCGSRPEADRRLFGADLPVAALTRAEQLAEGADLMLCIGSSLEVYPVAQLPQTTLDRGGRLAIVTAGATAYDAPAAVSLHRGGG